MFGFEGLEGLEGLDGLESLVYLGYPFSASWINALRSPSASLEKEAEEFGEGELRRLRGFRLQCH
jgi:hypothetical protein